MAKHRMFRFVILSLLFAIAGQVSALTCYEAAQKELHEEMLELCLEPAEQGDPLAMMFLGYVYTDVQHDFLEGYAWIHRAASAGEKDADSILAKIRRELDNRFNLLFNELEMWRTVFAVTDKISQTMFNSFDDLCDHSRGMTSDLQAMYNEWTDRLPSSPLVEVRNREQMEAMIKDMKTQR